jgi:DNA-binding transcriptional regulator YhcF (GntR family)
MARFETHKNGLPVLIILREELDAIRAESASLYAKLVNSNAVVTGQANPFSVTLVPSWNSGSPFMTPTADGGTQIEIDARAIGLRRVSSYSLEGLKVAVSGEKLTVVEGNGTTRVALETIDADLTPDDVVAFLRNGPLEPHALRLHLRQHDPSVVERLVAKLKRDGIIGEDDDAYTLLKDGGNLLPVLPRGRQSAILKALRSGKASSKSLAQVASAASLSKDDARIALEALIRDGKVYAESDRFCIPEPEHRRALSNTMLEALVSAEKSLTIDEVHAKHPELHPAWIERALENLLSQGRVTQEENGSFSFLRTERSQRNTGSARIKSAIREAETGGIAISDLCERHPTIPQWLIWQNLRQLVEEGKITIDAEREVATWNTPQKDAAPKRPSFRAEIREFLRTKGAVGVPREVVIQHFSDYPKSKVSVALNDLCQRGEAEFRMPGSIYLFAEPANFVFEGPVSHQHV